MLTTLPNGLRVASSKTDDETATVGVWIESGSRYETRENNGVAHFLEHVAFKGTEKRTKVKFEKEIEDMGAYLNAYTAREQTVYYIKCHKDDLKQGVDILSDMLLNAKLNPADVNAEKQVILREMEEVEKSFEETLLDQLHFSAFRDCSLGYTILGPEDNIQKMTSDMLKDFIHRMYRADKMVLVGVGEIEHQKLVEIGTQFFGQVKPSDSTTLTIPNEKPYFLGSQLMKRDDDMGHLVHCAVGYEGVPWTSGDSVCFMLIQQLIGTYVRGEGIVPGLLSSKRSVSEVAWKMQGTGCAENFSCFNSFYKHTGLFGFWGTCEETAVTHFCEEMIFSITRLCFSTMEEEVEQAKRELKTSLLGMLDNSTAIAEDVGRHLLVYGRRVTMVEFIKRLDALDAEEVKRVAWKYFYDKELVSTGIGPTHGIPALWIMQAKTNWLRY